MRAQQLAARNDDEAVAIYDKLITRLSALPLERRRVSNDRLQNILVQACVNAQAYHNVHERYDEALHVMDQMRQIVEEPEIQPLDFHRADILLTAGRVDEAIAVLRGIAEENGNDIEDLAAIFHAYVRVGQLDDAQRVLNEIEEQLAAQQGSDAASPADGEEDPRSEDPRSEDPRAEARAAAGARDEAFVYSLRSELAMERQQWQEAIDHYQQAVSLHSDYGDSPQFIYMPLVRNGQYEAALPFVRQDTARKVRSTFWEALALYHLGDVAQAEALWTEVTETELNEEEARNFNEVVLSFYYLGDAERMGLELLLRLINEVRNPNWSIFFLTGLGWAMHGNLRNARMNFDMARQQLRMTAQGSSFPDEIKRFVDDLLDGETRAELASYLDAGTPGVGERENAGGADFTSEPGAADDEPDTSEEPVTENAPAADDPTENTHESGAA